MAPRRWNRPEAGRFTDNTIPNRALAGSNTDSIVVAVRLEGTMMKHTVQSLAFDNPTDPGRPLKLTASTGRLEVRMGCMGITDVVADLDPVQARRLAAWLVEVTA